MSKNVERISPSATVQGRPKVRKGPKGGFSGKAVTGGAKKGAKAVPDKVAIAHPGKVKAVMEAAGESGLLGQKTGRISGRINPALIKQAKRRTGIKTDSDLIEFALANVALEDNFAEAFKRSRGTVDPNLKLGF